MNVHIELQEVTVAPGNEWNATSYPRDGNFLVRGPTSGMAQCPLFVVFMRNGQMLASAWLPADVLGQHGGPGGSIDVHRLFDQLAILTGKERA